MRKREVLKTAKKCLAYTLATVTVAGSALGGMTFVQEPEVVEAATSSMLSDEDRGVIYANSRTDFRDESIYFLITTRFYDGDTSNNARTSEDDNKAHNPEHDPSWRGDFKGLIEKLDYIKALGFTAIWITPVVQNDSGYDYHGYHAYNFSAVDTRYESNGVTYQDLIDAVHAKGMKIIQDVVLNHTCNWGEENLLQITSDIYAERNQVVMNGTGDPENIYHHNGFCGGGDWDNYSAQDKTIADDCFDLETENPKVYNYLVDCYKKYIEMGVDGFRVDTVKHISRLTFNTVFLPAFKEAGGEDFYMFGEVCTKGHDAWYRQCPPISTCFYTWDDDSSWKSRWSESLASNEALVQEHYAANMDIGSMPTSNNAFLNGNEYHTPDYSQKSGMDVIDFQMHWAFNNANQAYSTALGQDKYFNDSTWNVVYVDSHDYAPDQCQTQRFTGGTDTWAENLSLMFTFRGIPCIYYGSEIEFQAGKPIDVGPMQPLSETGRAYFGDHIEGNVETSDFTVFGNLSGEVQNTLNSTLSQHLMRLNRLRQAIPALRKGQYSTEGCNGNIAFKRRYTDSTTDSFVLVAISGDATFSSIPNGKYVDAVTGDVKNVTNGTLSASVSGRGNMKVYVLDTAKTPAPGRVIPNGDYLNDGGSAELIGPVELEKIEVTDITLNKTSVTVREAESATVTATVSPSDATNKTVKWTTSDATVATVSGGTITAVGVGTATITATTSNGLSKTVKVTVTENPDIVKPTGVTMSTSSLEIEKGSTGTLTATVKPTNATNKTLTWTSSDATVATVNDGVVTAVGAGMATITATTFNGYKATATVTVTEPDFPYIENGVYFEKPSGWGSTIYAYMWSNGEYPQGEWPGTAIKDLGNGIYGFSYTTTDSNMQIIFNDGNNQTADLKFVNNGLYNGSGFVKEVKPVVNGTVTVEYVDKDTAEVLSTITLKGEVGTSYTTSAKEIDGYTLFQSPANANGKFTESNITVSYLYQQGGQFQTLSTTAKVSATKVTKGDKVTVTATATGGSAPYKYTYMLQSNGTWSTLASNSSSSSYVWTTTAAGTYKLAVKVTDSAGNTKESSALTVTVDGGQIDTKLNGLHKDSSGNWYYYTNGIIDTSKNGLFQNTYGWWYVKAGKIDFTYTGMAQNSYGWWYVKAGKVDMTYTGLATNNYGTWYMKKGKLDTSVSGFVSVGSTWAVLNKGKVDTTKTGLYQNKYGWWYVNKGKVDMTYTGMAQNSYGWWYVKAGKIDMTYTGLATNNYGTWYMKKGKLDTSVSGFVSVGSTWAVLKNGKVDTATTGMYQNKYGWWYVNKGKVDLTYTGLAKNNYGTWYMKNGKLDTTYTGMVQNGSEWVYVSKGKLDTTYTGLAQNKYGMWYMKAGKVDFTYTGMAKSGQDWWYVKAGKVDTTYTGMAKNQYGWFYMKNGKYDSTYTGMAKNQYGWWYMKNGQLDKTYTGVGINQYGWWYMKNGKLDTSYSGTVKYNGKTYVVFDGQVVH